MHWLKLAVLIAAVVVPVAQAAEPPSTQPAAAAVARIEEAHGLDAWRSKEAVRTDLTVDFGGKRVIDGVLTFTTDAGRSRIDLRDGTTIVFDGSKAWVSPASADFPRARFHALTWPYFAAVPFKLRDGGANVADAGTLPLAEGARRPALKLTFAPGTGDAPDDWYLLYPDPQTGALDAMAYIVTYGADDADAVRKAQAEPHAIRYNDAQTTDGVTLARDWSFHNWSESQGIHGDPIGQVRLENLQFVTPEPGTFEKPADSREDALP